MQPVESFSPLSRESGCEIREVRSLGKCNLESGMQLKESRIHWKMIRNPVTGICKSWRGIQNPRLSWIPLHGAIFQCLVLSLGWSNSKKAAFLALSRVRSVIRHNFSSIVKSRFVYFLRKYAINIGGPNSRVKYFTCHRWRVTFLLDELVSHKQATVNLSWEMLNNSEVCER